MSDQFKPPYEEEFPNAVYAYSYKRGVDVPFSHVVGLTAFLFFLALAIVAGYAAIEKNNVEYLCYPHSQSYRIVDVPHFKSKIEPMEYVQCLKGSGATTDDIIRAIKDQ